VKKKVLVISPTPSHPQDAGNRTRIYNLLINLQKLGHEVHFFYIQHETQDDELMRQAWGDKLYSLPYTQMRDRKRSLAQKISRKLRHYLTNYPKYPGAVDDWYDNSVNEFLIELHQKFNFDVVIVEYVFFSKALNIFGKDVLKIIDTHDVFANRSELFKENGQKYYWYSTNLKEEAKGLRRGDLVIAIQKEEEEYFKKLVGNKVITVGHTVLLRRPKQMQPFKNKVLYIASLNRTNLHGIKYFINDVLPKVRAKLPDFQLLIAGKICEALDEVDGCVKLGYVKNLNEVYDNTNVVINPICFGTGLKIKSIEALGQSKVLITTPEGAKGLEAGASQAFLVSKNAEDFYQNIIEVLTNSTLSIELANQAYCFAENYNKKAIEPLEKILN
jgi:polysaccharide biosynthesis protein PslH